MNGIISHRKINENFQILFLMDLGGFEKDKIWLTTVCNFWQFP